MWWLFDVCRKALCTSVGSRCTGTADLLLIPSRFVQFGYLSLWHVLYSRLLREQEKILVGENSLNLPEVRVAQPSVLTQRWYHFCSLLLWDDDEPPSLLRKLRCFPRRSAVTGAWARRCVSCYHPPQVSHILRSKDEAFFLLAPFFFLFLEMSPQPANHQPISVRRYLTGEEEVLQIR